MRRCEFASWLAPFFERHVALKRAGGRDFSAQAGLLSRFDRYLTDRGVAEPLTRAGLSDYLSSLSRLSPRGRDNVVCAVWPALAFARRHGARVDPLPERPRASPAGTRQREPFVLARSEIDRLFAATRELAPTRLYARSTHATVQGLLYTTGLRVGEARGLDVGDFDREEETLLVQAGKFRKARLLPLPSSTAEALARHLDDPLRPVGNDANAPFFVSRRKRRLSCEAIAKTLAKAGRLAGLNDGVGPPRPHDLRHTFAVHRLLAWYHDGRDVNALLPVLSTYLGHERPAHTYTYLRSAKLLIEEAAQRFERAAGEALKAREA